MHEKAETIRLLIVSSSVVSLLLLVAFGLVFLIMKNKQQSFNLKLNLANADFEKTLLSSQIEIQEETLQIISREIHDNIGLSLTLAKLNLNTLDPCSNNCSNSSKINNAISLLTQSIQDLSEMSKGMNYDKISEDGLSKALEIEISRANKINKTTFSLSIAENLPFMSNEKELIIFRIIQEGINNILKHANAKNALIELQSNSEQFQLKILDDGIGQPEDFIKAAGNGLKNIKARTRLLEGELEISHSNPGTCISITIPIIHKY